MTDDNRNDRPPRFTRRGVLGTGAAMSAGAGLLALSGLPAQARAGDIPDEWDEEFDVVVIGSGFAGLSAAYEAQKAGSSVTVLEKMPSLGGNSAISGGLWSIGGTAEQEAAGIEDSPEMLERDMLAAGLDMNHVELARKVARESLDALQWSIEEIGVEYRGGIVHLGGHAVPRSVGTQQGTGAGITRPLIERLRENGVEPRTRVMLERLLRDSDGRVKGVEVRDGVPFPDDGSGETRTIRAARAVVLATGGFGNDLDFRMIQDPRLDEAIETTNQPGATAESLREALNIGCTPVQLSWIQLGPWTSPDERGLGRGPFFAIACAEHGIWLDTRTAHRFVDELADRKVRADAIIAAGNETIAIMDASGAELTDPELIDELLERDVVMRYDSVAELADAFGMPPDVLQETIDRWNDAVAEGEDTQYGRPMQRDQVTMDTAPWYAMRLSPKLHHTMGGVAINSEAQALDVSTGDVIPGLYCAGEITGGVHGAVRLGGCAYGDAIVFGRTAGRNAAAEDSWG